MVKKVRHGSNLSGMSLCVNLWASFSCVIIAQKRWENVADFIRFRIGFGLYYVETAFVR